MRADPSYREFWMGHSLGVDEHYVSRDPEFHRKEYKKGYESIRILEPATPQQIMEIAEQLKQKDQEIQELKAQNERLSARMDNMLKPANKFILQLHICIQFKHLFVHKTDFENRCRFNGVSYFLKLNIKLCYDGGGL